MTAHPNPKTARRIMAREGFRWMVWMAAVSLPRSGLAVWRLVYPQDIIEGWPKPRSSLVVDYTDARTAEILDEIVPGWREEVEG